MRATLLKTIDHNRVESFLRTTASESVFLLGMLERRAIASQENERWWGIETSEAQLKGLLFTGSRATPAGPGLWVITGDKAAGATMAEAVEGMPLPHMCIGPRETVDALWRSMRGPRPRLATDSRTYQCTQLKGGPTLDVRPAQARDLDWIREASIAMMLEDLDLNPRALDPDAHEARIKAGILNERSWIGFVGEERVFRVDVGTRCAHGAQIGGTWVPPEHRGRGLGAAGTRSVCARLLDAVPRITLHVRENNRPAVSCYTRIGFVPGAPLRLLVR